MTDYYIRTAANGGSDAAAGTSPATAWATISKALGASGIASGDTVYVGAGTYRAVTTVAMTSAVAETSIIGDVDGLKTGDAGEVILTAYTTNDTTTPSTSSLINLAGRDFLTFKKLTLVGGNTGTGSVINATTTNSVSIKFEDCTFLPGVTDGNMIEYVGLADVASNWTVTRCRFQVATCTGVIHITLPTSASADYDTNFQVSNCFFNAPGGSGVYITASGAGSFKGGGVDLVNCTHIGNTSMFRAASANIATSIPSTALYCLAVTVNNAFNANTAGQITENYCRIMSNAANTNVTNGAQSQYGVVYAMMASIGQEAVVGRALRPFFTPMSGSPILGLTNVSSPTVDILNRPRPAGGAITNAAGALERHDTATNNSPNGHKITGPGDQDIYFAVPASATTITITAEYDTNHAATNKPQAILLANGERGVAEQTVTMTAAVNTEEDIVIGPFTPTSAGVVTVRLRSRSAAANGIAQFKVAVPS